MAECPPLLPGMSRGPETLGKQSNLGGFSSRMAECPPLLPGMSRGPETLGKQSILVLEEHHTPLVAVL